MSAINILLVALGGAVGSILRYAVSALLKTPPSTFPVATFLVNITGCFVIGILHTMLTRSGTHQAELRLLLMTGILGGFTTFSSFGLEAVTLVKSGSFALAAGYSLSSLVIGIAAVYLGMRAA